MESCKPCALMSKADQSCSHNATKKTSDRTCHDSVNVDQESLGTFGRYKTIVDNSDFLRLVSDVCAAKLIDPSSRLRSCAWDGLSTDLAG